MRTTEFLLYALGIMTFVAAMTFGFDREMARRDFERYSTKQEELIVGCIFKANCKYYNDMLDKEDD